MAAHRRLLHVGILLMNLYLLCTLVQPIVALRSLHTEATPAIAVFSKWEVWHLVRRTR